MSYRRRALPRVLFKYLRREYAEVMCATGTLRLGTLWEYRDVEKHGAAIGDVGEGKFEVFTTADFDSSVPGSMKPVHRTLIDPGHGSVIVRNCLFSLEEEYPNCFLYCASEVLDRKVMEAFGGEVVVRIERPMDSSGISAGS